MSDHVHPRSLRVESTTSCQLKCPLCETAKGTIKSHLGGGFLRLEQFKQLIDDNPAVMHVELSNWGELFLNPELLQIMAYAFEQGVSLTAGNGANLNNVRPDVLEGLIKYQFRFISCAIDGASAQSYEKYRVRGNFDRVIDNIRRINTLKTEHGSAFPLLRWQFVPFAHNEHEIDTAKVLADELNMEFFLRRNWDPDWSPTENEQQTPTDSGVNTIPKDVKTTPARAANKPYCGQLWTLPQVNWDGRMLGCCINYWGDFGNVFEDGLENVINNDRMVRARQMLRGTTQAADDIPCATCHYYKEMQQTGDFMTDEDISRSSKEYHIPYWIGRVGTRVANHFPALARLYAKYEGLMPDTQTRP